MMKNWSNHILIPFLLFIVSCRDDNRESNLKSKESELPVKQELRGARGDSIDEKMDVVATSVKAEDYYKNLEDPFDTLIGCWIAIREGNITITFSKDSTFEFYDYNAKLKTEELLKGRFELDGAILTLRYNDRPKQRFAFKRDPRSHNEFRITNTSGYYFLKSDC